MANFKYINDEKHIELTMEGNLVDLLSNVCTMVYTIYEKLPEEAAESFKEQLTDAFEKGFPFMTGDEIAEKTNEIASEIVSKALEKEIASKALEKILGELKNILKDMKEDDEDA